MFSTEMNVYTIADSFLHIRCLYLREYHQLEDFKPFHDTLIGNVIMNNEYIERVNFEIYKNDKINDDYQILIRPIFGILKRTYLKIEGVLYVRDLLPINEIFIANRMNNPLLRQTVDKAMKIANQKLMESEESFFNCLGF